MLSHNPYNNGDLPAPLKAGAGGTVFDISKAVKQISGEADWVGLRHVDEKETALVVRDERTDHSSISHQEGIMVEALVDGQFGYAGTSDLSDKGIKEAAIRAREFAKSLKEHQLAHFDESIREKVTGSYKSPCEISLDSLTIAEINDLLVESCKTQAVSEKVVSRMATASVIEACYSFASSNGSDLKQDFNMVGLTVRTAANNGTESQVRSERDGQLAQIGAEAFDRSLLIGKSEIIAKQAVELLDADDCPNEKMTLVLDPGQMTLQIHESIGHPLEIDRILGDERNYAGSSFVKMKDFGQLQYGSELMNVVFDPTVHGEFASYGFDDSGTPATKEFLIKDGVLLRGLGGTESQFRSGLQGVANSRATSWNRPPLDRMANINLEPGNLSFEELISGIERGIYMQTNRSWSIDDYRNKFQFGCEYAQLIENGQLTKTIKNPNYRGITDSFWRNLDGVGDKSTFALNGTPHCGKAEPNQAIRVGHASPTCRFKNIEVFGGSN